MERIELEDGCYKEVYETYTSYFNKDGVLHRTCKDKNGLTLPAMEFRDGERWWFVNDKRHRLDGPAVEYNDGDKDWYIEGEELTEEEFNKRVKEIKGDEDKFDSINLDGVEEVRTYHFPCGSSYTIENPVKLVIRDSGSHVVTDSSGINHYIKSDWITFSFKGYLTF